LDFFMKRKRIALFSLLMLIYMMIPSTETYATQSSSNDIWPDGPLVNAQGAIVIEASTGLILYEKNIHETYYPASITKIMTALVALENSSLGDVVTFSKKAVFDVDIDSSRIGIDVGEQLTMQQCLYGILLESANEVSYAVAEHIGGTVENFAVMMNEKAKSIGCLNTHFVNPHGLPDTEHLTSPYDMALITREAMKNETFRKIFDTRTYKIPPTNIQPETRYLANHHKFILNEEYHYEDCIGGKTGYTSKAKYTLVSVAKRGDLEIICVIMRDDTSANQYKDTKKLLDYGFDNFSIYPIAQLETSEILEESPMFTRYNSLLSDSTKPITTDKDGYLVLPNTASFEDAVKEVSFYPASEIAEGSNVIGNISYTYQGKYVGGAEILYQNEQTPTLTPLEQEVKKPTINPDEEVPAKSNGSLRPVIIGIIIGLIVLIMGLYFVLVERPRLKRRKAYYKRRANRRMSRDDDYLDL
jgi:D-alanyl-D-alanine carboxypeptidase